MLSETDRHALASLASNPDEPQPEMIVSFLEQQQQQKKALEIKGMSEAEVRALIVPDDEDGITFGALYDILVEDDLIQPAEVSLFQFYIEYT